MKLSFLSFFLLLPTVLLASADLEIQTLKAVPGQDSKQIQLLLQFINHGPQNATHLGCNVYVYSNERLLVSQNFPLKSLAANEQRQESLSLQLDSFPATAIKAEIYDAVEPDVQPSTNFMQVNIKPPDYKRVDLQIVEATIETTQPLLDKAQLNIRLRNNGPDNVPFSKLTANLVVFDNVIATEERRIPRLAEGEEFTLKIGLGIAKSFRQTEGRLDLKWESADPDILDLVPQNNLVSLNAQLTPRLPDLIPQDVQVNKRGQLSFSVLNKGNIKSPASVTALYINGALVQRFATSELPPNISKRFQYTPAKISPDTMITVVCDFNADVEEFSEENNRLNFKSP